MEVKVEQLYKHRIKAIFKSNISFIYLFILRGPNSLTHNFKIINFKSLVSIDNKQLQEFIQSNDKKLGLRLRSLVSIYL